MQRTSFSSKNTYSDVRKEIALDDWLNVSKTSRLGLMYSTKRLSDVSREVPPVLLKLHFSIRISEVPEVQQLNLDCIWASDAKDSRHSMKRSLK